MGEQEKESLVREQERVVALAHGNRRARPSVGVLCLDSPMWTAARDLCAQAYRVLASYCEIIVRECIIAIIRDRQKPRSH